MPQITAVRVTYYQPNGIADMETHDLARDYGHNDAGYLDLYNAADRVIKTYRPDAWSCVELVHAEPEPIENLAVGQITTATMGTPITVTAWTENMDAYIASVAAEIERHGGEAERIAGIVIGAASTCWSNLEGAGVFESERASALADLLAGYIRGDETSAPEPTPAERLWTATSAIQDAQEAAARSAADHAQAIADAQERLNALQRELGEAA